MGHPHESLTERQARTQRERKMYLIYTVMICVGLLILVQLLLFEAALKGFLGGNSGVILPATLASGACFGGACWLIRYI